MEDGSSVSTSRLMRRFGEAPTHSSTCTPPAESAVPRPAQPALPPKRSNASGYVTPVNPTVSNTSISPYNMVPLSSVVKANWGVGPQALPRYNGYAAVEIVGNAASGYSTGQAMQALRNIIDKSLPGGFAADWTGQSYQEILAGNSATLLLVLSIVVVFLCLAALYESWSIPVAVLLVVPLGVLGMVLLCKLAGIPNDIYFKIGLVTVIGLAAKNAILIVEFAVDGQARGKTLFDAVIEAGKLRLAPHTHDLDGVHLGRIAAGPLERRRCRLASRDRHGRDRRHAVRHFPGLADDPRLLRDRTTPAGRQAGRGSAQAASMTYNER